MKKTLPGNDKNTSWDRIVGTIQSQRVEGRKWGNISRKTKQNQTRDLKSRKWDKLIISVTIFANHR